MANSKLLMIGTFSNFPKFYDTYNAEGEPAAPVTGKLGSFLPYRVRKDQWEGLDIAYATCIDAASGVPQIKKVCRMVRSERRDMLREEWGLL